MRSQRILRKLAFLGVVTLPLWGSQALAGVRVGLGGDYAFAPGYWYGSGLGPGQGLFELTLSADSRVFRHLSAGARFGALITSYPTELGVPVDLDLTLHLARDRVYLEGLVGPWFFLNDPLPIRLHAALGFGIQASGFRIGLELGSLNGPMAGLRLAWVI